jgi:hypothetical protein
VDQVDFGIGDGGEWENQNSGGTGVGRFEIKGPAMTFGQSASDGEAESRAPGAGSEEGFEDAIAVGSGDSCAVIADGRSQRRSGTDPGGSEMDIDLALGIAGVDRVFEQVAEDLLDSERVGREWRSIARDGEADLF